MIPNKVIVNGVVLHLRVKDMINRKIGGTNVITVNGLFLR